VDSHALRLGQGIAQFEEGDVAIPGDQLQQKFPVRPELARPRRAAGLPVGQGSATTNLLRKA
jgi:hypothetical protein